MKTSLSLFLLDLIFAAAHGEVITLAHPGDSLSPDQTVVWSPTFQAAWDQLNLKCGGLPVRVEPPNELMARLDSFRWDAREVMPVGAWKAWCGPASQDFLKQVNEEAAVITREPKGPFELLEYNPKNLAFFGLLDHKVEFLKEFFRSTKAPMKFKTSAGEQPVQFFGVRGDLSGAMAGAVSVLAWRPVDGSHAIQIRCKQEDDTVILYHPPKNQDFATACLWLRTWRAALASVQGHVDEWNDPQLHADDEIQIPYVSLKSKADFPALLESVRFYTENENPWKINRAEQITRFELHEKGATVRVEASGEAAASARSPTATRHFTYDRPFFVFLWRKDAEWPYFGAWIGDTSALKAFTKENN